METPTFEHLPNHVHFLVMQQLHADCPSGLFALRLVARTWNDLAESIIYKSISWRDNWAYQNYNNAIISRILQENDRLRIYVRKITIEEWHNSDATVLENVLQSLKYLTTFSWNSISPIPETVLLQLHHLWPRCELNVSNKTRGNAVANLYRILPLDIKLLSSPLLNSLDFTVVCGTSGANFSEFPVLTQILKHNSNLSSLRLGMIYRANYDIDVYNSPYGPLTTAGTSEVNLQFAPGESESFPTLQELGLSSGEYQLTTGHCLAWKACMDWSKLTTLEFDYLCPYAFFTEFRGCLPSLKVLGFAFWLHSSPTPTCPGERIVGQFLDSIHGLEELRIVNKEPSFFELWPYIQKHSSKLRFLQIHTAPLLSFDIPGWGEMRMANLLKDFSSLEKLSVDMNLKESLLITDIKNGNWPRRVFNILSQFSHLRSCAIHIKLPSPLQAKSEAEAYTVATELFRDFFKNSPKCKLRALELRVISIRYTGFADIHQTQIVVNVKKLERDDSPSPAEGGFKATVERFQLKT